MKNKQPQKNIKDIVRIRLKFLDMKVRKSLFWGAISFVAGISIRILVRWVLLQPYLGFFWESQNVSSTNIQYTMYGSMILIAIAYTLLAVSTLFLTITTGKILRLHYYMSIDSSRYLFMFSAFLFALAVLMWGYFFSILRTGDPETLIGVALSIVKYGSSGEMLFSVAVIALNINFIRHRKIIRDVLKSDVKIIYICTVLNILSFLEIAFVIPFLLYIIINKRLLHLFAYIDLI